MMMVLTFLVQLRVAPVEVTLRKSMAFLKPSIYLWCLGVPTWNLPSPPQQCCGLHTIFAKIRQKQQFSQKQSTWVCLWEFQTMCSGTTKSLIFWGLIEQRSKNNQTQPVILPQTIWVCSSKKWSLPDLPVPASKSQMDLLQSRMDRIQKSRSILYSNLSRVEPVSKAPTSTQTRLRI